MNTKTEKIMAIVAALLILFSAMWDARISIAVSIVLLVAFGIYKLLHKDL
jgi:EamA domain-containing membrane protein RarD